MSASDIGYKTIKYLYKNKLKVVMKALDGGMGMEMFIEKREE